MSVVVGLGLAACLSQAQDEADPPPSAETEQVEASVDQPADAGAVRPDAVNDGKAYEVSSIDLKYAGFAVGDSRLPDINEVRSEVRRVEFMLVPTEEGLIGPREGTDGVAYTLDSLFEAGPVVLFGSAIRVIGGAIAGEVLSSADIFGVYAVPSFDQIAPDGTELRDGDTSLIMDVRVGVVSQVRTIASGDRVDFDDRIDNAKHDRIRRNSPAQPMLDGGPAAFIPARPLEDYLFRLNRHPGRRVELAVAPGEGHDEAVVDYLVYEYRPWRLYAQVSNTGTEQTNTWRERFGYTNTQLTGRDDIFNLEYSTAGFEDTYAVAASYDTPLVADNSLRARVSASWNEFSASDVGVTQQQFTGKGASISGDLVYNVFQHRDLFVDAFVGARLFRTQIDNLTADLHGKEEFFVPRVGLSMERYRDTSSFDAAVEFEWSMAGVTGVSEAQLANLGRLNADRNWQVLRANVGYSFYLEPLLDKSYVPAQSMLAHEVSASARGQWAMDHRLIPVEQQVAGGLYSVRGYPESIAAGDSVVIGTLEYRFHVPRALSAGAPRKGLLGNDFRWRPSADGQSPDWDLLARGFVDAARTLQSNREGSFEYDETLVGTGLGLELVVRRNLSIRADWGIALKDMKSGEVTAGSNRFYFSATFVY